VPTGRWKPEEALDHFLKSRANTIAFLESTADLRAHVGDSPLARWTLTNGCCLWEATASAIPNKSWK
jgi:hypothetical protein